MPDPDPGGQKNTYADPGRNTV